MKSFHDKLTMLVIETTGGKTISTGLESETVAEVVEAMASHLGKFIALSCAGCPQAMSTFLEGASAYMFESATDMQKAGQFLGDPSNWYTVGADGVARKGGQV